MTVDPTDLAIWTRAWAISRGCPAALPAMGGWFTFVDLPDQVSRYVFPTLDPARLRALGSAIREPYVLVKVPVNAEAVQAALGRDWLAEQTGWFMRIRLCDEPVEELDGFTVSVTDGPTRRYDMRAGDGTIAARARLTVLDGRAIVDSVDTEPAFRRQGLATALMQRLGADARAAGATVGLLTSTHAGRTVYERRGWDVLAPWTTAQLKVSQ